MYMCRNDDGQTANLQLVDGISDGYGRAVLGGWLIVHIYLV